MVYRGQCIVYWTTDQKTEWNKYVEFTTIITRNKGYEKIILVDDDFFKMSLKFYTCSTWNPFSSKRDEIIFTISIYDKMNSKSYEFTDFEHGCRTSSSNHIIKILPDKYWLLQVVFNFTSNTIVDLIDSIGGIGINLTPTLDGFIKTSIGVGPVSINIK